MFQERKKSSSGLKKFLYKNTVFKIKINIREGQKGGEFCCSFGTYLCDWYFTSVLLLRVYDGNYNCVGRTKDTMNLLFGWLSDNLC